MEINSSLSISKRINKDKGLIIEQLKKLPIIQIACEKTGIGRASYYRWKEQDELFAKEANKAIILGREFINEMAESQLLTQIKEQNMTAIIFWLKHNHYIYTTRVEITQKNDEEKDQLKPEEEIKVKKALKMAGLLVSGKKEKNNE